MPAVRLDKRDLRRAARESFQSDRARTGEKVEERRAGEFRLQDGEERLPDPVLRRAHRVRLGHAQGAPAGDSSGDSHGRYSAQLPGVSQTRTAARPAMRGESFSKKCRARFSAVER